MLASMRRLHPRGRDCRGIAVDADGATLGPDCVLVRRPPAGFRCLDLAVANALQKAALALAPEPDWLFEQCRRIAEALAKGDVALAQSYGLRIPVAYLDDAALRKLADAACLIKAGFDPNQPRVPPATRMAASGPTPAVPRKTRARRTARTMKAGPPRPAMTRLTKTRRSAPRITSPIAAPRVHRIGPLRLTVAATILRGYPQSNPRHL